MVLFLQCCPIHDARVGNRNGLQGSSTPLARWEHIPSFHLHVVAMAVNTHCGNSTLHSMSVCVASTKKLKRCEFLK